MRHLEDARWIGRGRAARDRSPRNASPVDVFLDSIRGKSYTVDERDRIYEWFKIGWNDHGNKRNGRAVIT